MVEGVAYYGIMEKCETEMTTLSPLKRQEKNASENVVC